PIIESDLFGSRAIVSINCTINGNWPVTNCNSASANDESPAGVVNCVCV
ncbi:unnamed protein product, partial [Rotaria sp. Silwood2]